MIQRAPAEESLGFGISAWKIGTYQNEKKLILEDQQEINSYHALSTACRDLFVHALSTSLANAYLNHDKVITGKALCYDMILAQW